MNKENNLGVMTFIFHILQRSLFGIFLILIAINLPLVSRFVIWAFNIGITPDSAALIERGGNMLVAVFATLGMIAVIFGIVSSYINHISNTYELEDSAIKLRRGFISKTEISIPYKGIQTVNIEQSIVFRILGLSRLVIFSSGDQAKDGDNADQIFPVIDNSIALYLRDFLLKKSNIQETQEIK